MFTYTVIALLAIAVQLVAGDPTFVGRFQIEEDSKTANYKRLFEAVGFNRNEVREMLALVPSLVSEINMIDGKIKCTIGADGREVSNTFTPGIKKSAKLLVGGKADTTVYIQSEYRLAVNVNLPKADLMVVWDCDDEACSAIYSAKNVNLVTKWKRVYPDSD